MSAKRYLISVLGLGISSLLFLTVLLMVQGWLPGGAKVDNLSFDLALNTAVSFITNTNWQAYSGELALSNSTQVFGLTVQNFFVGGSWIGCSLCIHSWIGSEKRILFRQFWQDMVRGLLYILLPLSTIIAILLISQGVVQTFSSGMAYNSLEGENLLVISWPCC